MRKETAMVVNKFILRKAMAMSRTHTNGTSLFLHGNEIAKHDDEGNVLISFAGWPTATTSDRLNAVINLHPNVSKRLRGVKCKGGKIYLVFRGGDKVRMGDMEWVNISLSSKLAAFAPFKINEHDN